MKNVLLLATALLLFVSCASDKAVKADIAEEVKESTVTNSAELGGTIHELIRSSKTLTDSEKSELIKIMDEKKALAIKLSEQSYKLRAVLISELLSGKATDQRIRIIESDIKKIEKERLKNTFDTVKKISKIVVKEPDNIRFSMPLMNYERATR